jgi:putative inorganic carbon (hco3(-)) transporter
MASVSASGGPGRVSPAADRLGRWLLPAGMALCWLAASVTVLQVMSLNPKVGPIVVAAAAVGIALAWRPGWIVPSFLALTWCSLDASVFGGLPSPVQTGGLVLLLVVVWRSLSRPDALRAPLLVTLLIALPALASGLVNGAIHLQDFRDLTFLFIAALGLRTIADVRRATIALTVVGAVLGIGAAYSILAHPTGLFPVVDEAARTSTVTLGRAAGPFGEPNFFALSMAALVPIALLNVVAGGWRRPLGVISVAALLAGVLATGSRGGLLAATVGVVVFGVAAGGTRARAGALATLLVGVALLPLFATQTQGSQSRTLAGRATENRIAVAMFRDHPVVGVGPGVYPSLYRDYARHIGNDPRIGRAAHSLPLQIAAEQGLAGLVGWGAAGLAVAGIAVRRRLWRSLTGRALLVSVATYLTGSLFLHGSQLRLLFVLVGMVLAMAAAERDDAPGRAA